MASTEETDFQKIMKMVYKDLLAGDPQIIGVFVALAVVFLTILYLLFRGKNKRNGVLIVGLCDSGKTLLWNRLVYGKFVNTHTSMKDNAGVYSNPSDKAKSLRLFDTPGHERSRNKFIDSYKDNARGVMFVIDSTTVQKEIKDVAELLYTMLSDGVISYNAPPILIACNKHDQTFAKSSKVIQGQLEKEMNTLRVTRSAALDSIEGTANNNTFLGKRNKDFEFADIRPFKVDFVECNGRGQKDENEASLEGIENWLSKIA